MTWGWGFAPRFCGLPEVRRGQKVIRGWLSPGLGRKADPRFTDRETEARETDETLQAVYPACIEPSWEPSTRGCRPGLCPRTGAGHTLTPDMPFYIPGGSCPSTAPRGVPGRPTVRTARERRPRQVAGPTPRCWHGTRHSPGPSKAAAGMAGGADSEPGSKGSSRLSPGPEMKGGPEGGQSPVPAW